MATETPERSVDLQICPACSSETAPGFAVCIYCGVVLDRERLELDACGACESILMVWQAYCMRCGSPAIREGSAASEARKARPNRPPQPDASRLEAPAVEDRAAQMLAGMRAFLFSRRGAVIGGLLLLLAVFPWFLGGDQVVVRLIVPPSGETLDKGLGDTVQVEAVALNAVSGSTLRVFVDGKKIAAYEITDAVGQGRPGILWQVQGGVGSTHEFTVELESPGGAIVTAEAAVVLVVD